jgi:hypothetical protein
MVCLPLCLLLAPDYPPLASREPRVAPNGSGTVKSIGDPIAFLEKCLERYDREVKSYTLTFHKRERIDETLYPVEVIKVHFKDNPHSVFFEWLRNPRKALRVLYVAGENNNNMLALPTIRIAGVVSRALDSDDAKQSGRYTIAEFGLKQALQRIVGNWKRARAEKALHVEYLGIHKVVEAGDRPCHKFHRTGYAKPEDGGVTELILYVDTETQLQVGSVLLGEGGQLLGEYFFRDIQLNPKFAPEQFQRAALTAPGK